VRLARGFDDKVLIERAVTGRFFLPAPGPGGESGEPVINEVNTFPGMTAESQFPQIWQRAGLPFAALLDLLVAAARRLG
jgi:D-alanine-D-alanine ligase-like ATP-grasp enzyme